MESCCSANYAGANLMRYDQLAEYLCYYGLPFTIGGGGWDQSPEDFVTNVFADMIPGVPLHGKGEGTCRSAAGRYSMIDYWLTSPDIYAACRTPKIL
eukprot:5766843-Pyramimonas_sp.AAC.1